MEPCGSGGRRIVCSIRIRFKKRPTNGAKMKEATVQISKPVSIADMSSPINMNGNVAPIQRMREFRGIDLKLSELCLSSVRRMCLVAPEPMKAGELQDGEDHSVSRTCAGHFWPQVGPQFAAGNPGSRFNAQYKFSGGASLRSRKPIPNLGLCGADAIS